MAPASQRINWITPTLQCSAPTVRLSTFITLIGLEVAGLEAAVEILFICR
jgi:hypothetical protein